MFFFEKKNQKTFISSVFVLLPQYVCQGTKSLFGSFSSEKEPTFFSFLLLFLAATAAAAQPRHLSVSLYPYIPGRYQAALSLKQDFERMHPEVVLDLRFNDNYYSLKPEDRGVLYEDADIHEIDSALLNSFLKLRRLAPLGMTDLAQEFDPQALSAGMRDGALIAAPHWMCADFLFYRADEPALGTARTLEDVARVLGPSHGLLMDLSGEETLAEILLDMRLDENASPDLAFAQLGEGPTEAETTRMQQILVMEPAGFGRDTEYDVRGVFYARQFARRAGGAYLGYSETLNAVAEESAQSCRHEDRCVALQDVRVTRFPFADKGKAPGIWVDVYAIDGRLHGQALEDARAFIRYAVSLPVYRALLIPASGETPRYLLPATKAAYADSEILHAAPLYSRFHALMEGGATLQGEALGESLRETARRLDRALP